jgi:hypothetical protein
MNKKYIVISTIKDEVDNFRKQITMLENQEIKPLAWYIIVDDFFLHRYTMIRSITKHSFPIIFFEADNLKTNYYLRLAKNLDKLVNKIQLHHLAKCDWVMKLDGDITIPNDYVTILFNELEKDTELYSISGGLNTRGIKDPKRYNDFPLGAAMLFHKELINYWQGYPTFPASDTVLNLTAIHMGKKVKMIDKTMMTQNRKTSSRVKMNPTISTAIKHYYLRYPLGLTILYILKEKPLGIFKYFNWYLKNKKHIEKDRLSDQNIIKINISRLKKHKLSKYYFKLMGAK